MLQNRKKPDNSLRPKVSRKGGHAMLRKQGWASRSSNNDKNKTRLKKATAPRGRDTPQKWEENLEKPRRVQMAVWA